MIILGTSVPRAVLLSEYRTTLDFNSLHLLMLASRSPRPVKMKAFWEFYWFLTRDLISFLPEKTSCCKKNSRTLSYENNKNNRYTFFCTFLIYSITCLKFFPTIHQQNANFHCSFTNIMEYSRLPPICLRLE